MEKCIAWSDGNHYGNGDSFVSYVILDENKQIIKQYSAKLINSEYSEQAKELAFLILLKEINELKFENINIYTDSQGIVTKIKGRKKKKNVELKSLANSIVGKNKLKRLKNTIGWKEKKENEAKKFLKDIINKEDLPVYDYFTLFKKAKKNKKAPLVQIGKRVEKNKNALFVQLDKRENLTLGKYSAWSDGSYVQKGEGQGTYISYVILNKENEIIEKYKAKLLDVEGADPAEKYALAILMKRIKEMGIKNFEIFSDSVCSVKLLENLEERKTKHEQVNAYRNGFNKIFTKEELAIFKESVMWRSRIYNIAHNCFKEIKSEIPELLYEELFENKKINGYIEMKEKEITINVPNIKINKILLLPKNGEKINLIVNQTMLKFLGKTIIHTNNDFDEIKKFLQGKIEKSIKVNTKEFTGFVSGRMHIFVENNEIIRISFARRNTDSILSQQYLKEKQTKKELFDVDLKIDRKVKPLVSKYGIFAANFGVKETEHPEFFCEGTLKIKELTKEKEMKQISHKVISMSVEKKAEDTKIKHIETGILV